MNEPAASLEPRVMTAFFGRFSGMRPSQAAALAPLLRGENVVLSAGTGSGKTEAVLAPIVGRHWRLARDAKGVVVLYVVPTKALANDLEGRLHGPLDNLHLRVGVRHGDRDDLERSVVPQVLLTTPESLEVLVMRRDPALSEVRAVVIDEAHLLYNTQRGLQLSVLLRRLATAIGRRPQWAALSATVTDLASLRDFLFGPREDAVLLKFPSERSLDAVVRRARGEDDALETLRSLVRRPGKVLLFANSRRECERLSAVLQRDAKLAPGVFTHYSSLSPDVRRDVERRFGAVRSGVCVATSTLELGIDIGDVDFVVLWGVPNGVSSLLQRVGRGNRRSRKTTAICLVPDTSKSPARDALLFAAMLGAARAGRLPEQSSQRLFGAVAQQFLATIAASREPFTRVVELCDLVDHHPHLDRATVEAVLAELAAREYLVPHGYKNRYGAGERLHELVEQRRIYGNFPLGSQSVSVKHGAQVLGEVPAENLLSLQPGSEVRFVGQHWRVARISPDGIALRPSTPSSRAVDFRYFAREMALDEHIVHEAWRFLQEPEHHGADDLSQSVREELAPWRRKDSPFRGRLAYAQSGGRWCYATFAGRAINRAVALRLGRRWFQAADFCLTVDAPVDWASLPTDPAAYVPWLGQLAGEAPDETLFQKLLPQHLRAAERAERWRRSLVVPEVLGRLASSRLVQTDDGTLLSLT